MTSRYPAAPAPKLKACISLAVFKSPDARAAIAQLPECAAAFCRESVNTKPTQSQTKIRAIKHQELAVRVLNGATAEF